MVGWISLQKYLSTSWLVILKQTFPLRSLSDGQKCSRDILCPPTEYYARQARAWQGPRWREKGFLDRWGWAPYRAIQGAFPTAHWATLGQQLGGAIYICMHDRVLGYKGKRPHSCRWQLGGLDDLVRKTPCVGESDTMGPTDMRIPLWQRNKWLIILCVSKNILVGW